MLAYLQLQNDKRRKIPYSITIECGGGDICFLQNIVWRKRNFAIFYQHKIWMVVGGWGLLSFADYCMVKREFSPFFQHKLCKGRGGRIC